VTTVSLLGSRRNRHRQDPDHSDSPCCGWTRSTASCGRG